jgi:hypothetical protein
VRDRHVVVALDAVANQLAALGSVQLSILCFRAVEGNGLTDDQQVGGGDATLPVGVVHLVGHVLQGFLHGAASIDSQRAHSEPVIVPDDGAQVVLESGWLVLAGVELPHLVKLGLALLLDLLFGDELEVVLVDFDVVVDLEVLLGELHVGLVKVEPGSVAASGGLGVPRALHASVCNPTVVVLLLAISTLLEKAVELLARLTEVLGEVLALLVGELASVTVVEADVSNVVVLGSRGGHGGVNHCLGEH